MPFESLKTSIYMLLDEMTNAPEDLHQLQENLREQISELRAMGLPVPQDIIQAEKDLSLELNPPKSV